MRSVNDWRARSRFPESNLVDCTPVEFRLGEKLAHAAEFIVALLDELLRREAREFIE